MNGLPIKLLIVLDLGIRFIRSISFLPAIDHVFDRFGIIYYLLAVGVIAGGEIEGGQLDFSWVMIGIPSQSLRITGFLYLMRCQFFILSYIYLEVNQNQYFLPNLGRSLCLIGSYLCLFIIIRNKMNQEQNQHEQPNKDVSNEFMGNKPNGQPNMAQDGSELPLNVVSTKHERSIQIKAKRQDSKKQKGVQDNPEYFRVDFQITHKLYQIYRRLKIVTGEQSQASFQEKEQGNNTINYHKIMEIFKDIGYKLQINQKLQILRAIKKFCFNQNYISQEQFTKIFKVIVHGIGIKEVIFKPLIANKYPSVAQKQSRSINHKKAVSIKINKNFGKKMKTQQTHMQSSQLKSHFTQVLQQQRSFQTVPTNNKSYLKKIPALNPSIIEEKVADMRASGTSGASAANSARKHESRRRMITDASRYQVDKGYLNRAIEKNKVGKLTWENLFKMTQDNMHSYISIPSFVTQDINMNDLEM